MQNQIVRVGIAPTGVNDNLDDSVAFSVNFCALFLLLHINTSLPVLRFVISDKMVLRDPTAVHLQLFGQSYSEQ